MGHPGLVGSGFFCVHALGDTKQKKPTPLDQGPPLRVNRVLIDGTSEPGRTLYNRFQLILVHTVFQFALFYTLHLYDALRFYVSRVRIVTPRCFLYIAVQVHVENHARCPINNKITDSL